MEETSDDITNIVEYPEILYDKEKNTSYRRGNFLGMGSFGCCFIAIEKNSGKSFAVKIIDKQLLNNSSHSDFVSDEFNIHKVLRHKNIVSFYKAFDDAKYIFLLMELCINGSLLDVKLNRHCVTLIEAKYYIYNIINGVSYLHKNHIVHGDLKLSNIFINDRMAVKIGDFGLATELSFEGEEIEIPCGTPNYMAPEIVRKERHSYAGDVWAVGCILYALVTGKLPFESIQHETTLNKIINCDYCIYVAGIRKQVSTFIRKILLQDPNQRPSINELKKDEFLQGFIPLTLPQYTLWEPPHLKHLITMRQNKILKITSLKRNKSTNFGRRKRIKSGTQKRRMFVSCQQ